MHTFPVNSRFARLLLVGIVLGIPHWTSAQSDDFDDGNDDGWTRYDRSSSATFSFPNGGYRLQATSVGSAETQKALAFSTRSEEYTNFYVAVDLRSWDNEVRSAIGPAFRVKDVGPGTTKGFVAYFTPAISGGGYRLFSIYYIYNDVPFFAGAVAATIVTLNTNHSYRIVAKGADEYMEAALYDLNDLTRPVAYLSNNVPLSSYGLPEMPTSGKSGVFAYSRNNTTVDVTYDNYVAAAQDPLAVPRPAITHPIPPTPFVINRSPASDKNFYLPTNGISFNATTLSTNEIAPSGIKLILNGADVSANLVIGGTPTNRSATYSGLTSNKLYQASIRLTETTGKSSTNDFYFDTFSENYITSSAVTLVEAEDYNYSSGGYTNNPVPSGYDSSNTQVNGNGWGYLDQVGTYNVDFFDYDSSPPSPYNVFRFFDRVGTFTGAIYYAYVDVGTINVFTNDTLLTKFTSLGLLDYQVYRTEGGEWLNYTRDFASGNYNVYLRLSSYSVQDVLFDEVTSDRSLPGQTTTNLGKFQVVNTGHLSTYRYFPLVDDLGNAVALNWSGQKTFRLTMGGPRQDYTRFALQMNYLMFVPAPITVAPFQLINPRRNGDVFSVDFQSQSSVQYKLQYKSSLTDLMWVDSSSTSGDGSLRTLSDTSSQPGRFYRVTAN